MGLDVNCGSCRRREACAKRAYATVVRNGGTDSSDCCGHVVRPNHGEQPVRVLLRVDAFRAECLDVVLSPQYGARCDLILPTCNSCCLGRQAQQVLAVLQVRVQAGQPQCVLTCARLQVRIVDCSDQRDGEDRQRNQANGQREPRVVERGAAHAVRAWCQHRRRHGGVVHAGDCNAHHDRSTATREEHQARLPAS